MKEECLTIQEVLSIKEEPEEEQVGTLLLDCQGRPAHLLGSEVRMRWSTYLSLTRIRD